MRVAAVIGNPNRGGRTTTVATAVAARVATLADGEVDLIELSDVAAELFSWTSEAAAAITTRVATADAAIFASPTYKAGMTGLMKAFLDRYGNNGLAGLTAIPVMLGAARDHALAVETQFRPVLVELAATTPTKGVYVVDSELDRLEETIDAWWVLAGPPLRALLGRTPPIP